MLKPADFKIVEKAVQQFRLKVKDSELSKAEELKDVIGDLVWWMPEDSLKRKFDQHAGPFEVINRLSDNIFEIREREFGTIYKASLRHMRLCA